MTNLGVAVFLQGRTDEAIALHRRALAIEENDPLALRYQDRYRREGGAWRIARRELVLDCTQDLPLEG